MTSSFKKQYLDPRWQKKRLEILERDNFSCLICGDKEKTLHIHHLCYTKGGFVWEVDDTALMTLCSDCHKVKHLKNLTELEHKLIHIVQDMAMAFDGQNYFVTCILKHINEVVLEYKGEENG